MNLHKVKEVDSEVVLRLDSEVVLRLDSEVVLRLDSEWDLKLDSDQELEDGIMWILSVMGMLDKLLLEVDFD